MLGIAFSLIASSSAFNSGFRVGSIVVDATELSLFFSGVLEEREPIRRKRIWPLSLIVSLPLLEPLEVVNLLSGNNSVFALDNEGAEDDSTAEELGPSFFIELFWFSFKFFEVVFVSITSLLVFNSGLSTVSLVEVATILSLSFFGVLEWELISSELDWVFSSIVSLVSPELPGGVMVLLSLLSCNNSVFALDNEGVEDDSTAEELGPSFFIELFWFSFKIFEVVFVSTTSLLVFNSGLSTVLLVEVDTTLSSSFFGVLEWELILSELDWVFSSIVSLVSTKSPELERTSLLLLCTKSIFLLINVGIAIVELDFKLSFITSLADALLTSEVEATTPIEIEAQCIFAFFNFFINLNHFL